RRRRPLHAHQFDRPAALSVLDADLAAGEVPARRHLPRRRVGERPALIDLLPGLPLVEVVFRLFRDLVSPVGTIGFAVGLSVLRLGPALLVGLIAVLSARALRRGGWRRARRARQG